MKNGDIGYCTKLGECVCGDSLTRLSEIDDCSVDLVVTSPPFALQRKKEYGNEEQSEYVDWLCQFASLVFKKLKETGSFVIDIGGAYEKGKPSYSLYQFKALIRMCDEIGFKLAQPFYWHNPSALPAPIEWVNKRKLRAKTSVNTVWWLCKNPLECKANVTNVLAPYSSRMQRLISNPEEFVKEDGTVRPSGHVLGKSSWGKDNDLVIDIFGGSNTTGQVAEKLHRKWRSFELSQEYVAISSFRFAESKEAAKQFYDDIMNGKNIDVSSQQETLF